MNKENDNKTSYKQNCGGNTTQEWNCRSELSTSDAHTHTPVLLK